jgi:hypothetical protein
MSFCIIFNVFMMHYMHAYVHTYMLFLIQLRKLQKKKVCFKLEQKVRNIKSMFIYMVRKFHVPSN